MRCSLPACFTLLTVTQQPTSFWLEAHSISHVFETPELITALASFSESIPDSKPIVDARKATDPAETSASLLFLRIQAAADFYSLNKTRMSNPPDVKVDISKVMPCMRIRHLLTCMFST